MLLAFVGQADYGVFQTSNSFVFSLVLLSFGFSESYVRFYTHKKSQDNADGICQLNGMYLLLYLGVCAIVIALGFSFAANAEHFFSNSFTSDQVALAKTLMAVMSVNIACTLFSTVFDAYILVHEQFKYQQTRQLLTTLATPVIAYLLLYVGMGAIGVAIAQLSVSVILLALNARFAIWKLGMRFDVRRFDRSLFKAIAVFSGWIFANQICDLANQNVPNILLGALTGATVVAVFAVSVQIRTVFVSLSTAMSNVFIPKINQMVAMACSDMELTRLMTRVGRYQMLLFCWVYCGFVLLGRFFIDEWAGEGFADAYWLICVMALPLGVPLCQNTGIEIQRAKNQHKARSLALLAMAIFNVVFTSAAAPSMGYWAPAIAYFASIALGNGLFMNWYYHKRMGLDMVCFWKRVFPVIVVSAAVVVAGLLAMRLFPVTGWFCFVAWGLTYSAVFAAVMYLFVLDERERKNIASHIPFLR